MTILIASLGAGKGSWTYIIELVKKQEWEQVMLVTNSFGAERFSVPGRELAFVIIDDTKEIPEITQQILTQLKGKSLGMEVALNIVSGTGKEHMALLSSLLKLGVGIRLVGLNKETVDEL